jgi:hypothetical protein
VEVEQPALVAVGAEVADGAARDRRGVEHRVADVVDLLEAEVEADGGVGEEEEVVADGAGAEAARGEEAR